MIVSTNHFLGTSEDIVARWRQQQSAKKTNGELLHIIETLVTASAERLVRGQLDVDSLLMLVGSHMRQRGSEREIDGHDAARRACDPIAGRFALLSPRPFRHAP